jgi:hypothetical protein
LVGLRFSILLPTASCWIRLRVVEAVVTSLLSRLCLLVEYFVFELLLREQLCFDSLLRGYLRGMWQELLVPWMLWPLFSELYFVRMRRSSFPMTMSLLVSLTLRLLLAP